MRKILIHIGLLSNLDKVYRKFESLVNSIVVVRIGSKIGSNFKFIPQGPGGIAIHGDLTKFSIHNTSHLKSSTYIDCSGGVCIGKHFHTGRCLTILSSNHNYEKGEQIPYDNKLILDKVEIGDYVWCGLNVTILPGVKIGDGAVIGAGSIVTKDIPSLAIVAGNPAKIIKLRDKEHFYTKVKEGALHV
jgi:acetyltransferase-like isoleucine patch superfamily enzyme